jgi:hypothetical protein
MRQTSMIIVLALMLFSKSALGNDTTSLYKGRLQQLHQLSEWLKTKPNGQGSLESLNTNVTALKIYDTAFALFYDKPSMDSLFAIDTQVFGPSAKFRLMKDFLCSYDNLLDKVPYDSMRFRSPQPLNSPKALSQEDSDAAGIISLYLLIDGKEYEIFGFYFAPNSAKLTGITDAGGDQATHKIIGNYVERLTAGNK